MAKRFTDSEKWKDPWFRKLPPVGKCVWIFLLDNCNHAGIWKVDIDAMNFYIDSEWTTPMIKECLGNKIIEIKEGEEWFVPRFIEFQYNVSPDNLDLNNRVHFSVYQILINKGLIRGLQGDKDKDKERDKDKDKVKDINKIDPEILKLVTNFYDYQYPNHEKQLREYKSNPDLLIFDSAQVVDKLMRLDGYEIKDILMTLEFAVHDEFWSPNVISLRGLRKRKDGTTKFDKVYSKMKQSRKTGLGAIDDWVKSREAGEPMSAEWLND